MAEAEFDFGGAAHALIVWNMWKIEFLRSGSEEEEKRVINRTVGPTTYFVRGTASGSRPLERGFWLEFGHSFAFRLA